MRLKIRRMLLDEEFYTSSPCGLNPRGTLIGKWPYGFHKSLGWVVYEKNPYSHIAGIVTGIPGYWWLSYHHEEKGIIKEKIAVPRAAIHRMAKVIEDNSRCPK